MSGEDMEGLEARVYLVLEYRGREVLNPETALLLKYIDEYGSILLAARALGMPYSKAWESIARVERLLGRRVVERRRGGAGRGGARLSGYGRRLLSYYLEAARKAGVRVTAGSPAAPLGEAYVVAGSHDVVLEELLGWLRREKGYAVEAHWVGSAGGLASLMLGETLLAPSHLYDEESGRYTVPFLERYWLADRAAVIRGYDRELVLAYPPRLSIESVDEAVEKLLRGELRLINRNPGSGTRLLIDSLLRRGCEEAGIPWRRCTSRVKGYGSEARTHFAAAKAIVSGDADVGVLLRCAADFYGLPAIHLRWEQFDYVTLRESLGEKFLEDFREALRSQAPMLAGKHPGYRVPRDTGKTVYP